MRTRLGSLRWQTLLALAAVLAFLVGANLVAREIAEALNFDIRPSTEDTVHRVIVTAAASYTLLIAIPFVPGVEIGLAIIAVLGRQIVPLIYCCTVVGLTGSFIVGRIFPLRSLSGILADLHLARASGLLKHLASLNLEARLNFLVQKAPSRVIPFLLRHRYIALALAINLPGNFLIGGGGGIAMAAGVTGIYSIGGFVATVIVAVAPVPLAIIIFGEKILMP